MDNLYLAEQLDTFSTPFVNFDVNSKVFEIGGESFLEDADAFYDPILKWLQEFKGSHNEAITFNFKFIYYNSSSSKSVLKILKILKEYAQKAAVEINWCYPEDNLDLLQEGKDFVELLGISINFVAC
jgi:hypothetical protein